MTSPSRARHGGSSVSPRWTIRSTRTRRWSRVTRATTGTAARRRLPLIGKVLREVYKDNKPAHHKKKHSDDDDNDDNDDNGGKAKPADTPSRDESD